MNLKAFTYTSDEIAYCTVCGESLKPQTSEKYQIRWENKNSGVCQTCVISLRKGFRPQRNKTPIKFRTKEFYDYIEFDANCVAMAESNSGVILGEIKDIESNDTLGVVVQDETYSALDDCEDNSWFGEPDEDEEDFDDFDDFEEDFDFDDGFDFDEEMDDSTEDLENDDEDDI